MNYELEYQINFGASVNILCFGYEMQNRFGIFLEERAETYHLAATLSVGNSI
jgi:hypothetical protein